jgi:hypothetical protein
MPHDYDVRAKRFIKGSRVLTRAEVRYQIDRLTEHVGRKAKRVAARYAEGKINVPEFELEMRDILKAGHIVAAAIGKGGRTNMTVSDWGAVGARVKKEYQYLAKFSRKIRMGKISKILTTGRAQKYASAIRITFYRAFGKEQSDEKKQKRVKRVLNAQESCDECVEYAAMGYIPLDEMPLLGELECGPFCKCDLVFEEDEQDESA